jgi:tetratricopeptide (TPR) repeat protein
MLHASILVVLVVTAILTARRWPGPAAALAAYLGMLFPVIGIVQVGLQSAADRYMYLPSIPLLLLLGYAFGWAYQWTADAVIRSAVACVAALGCVGWSVATIHQIPIWTDAVTLWSTCYQRTLDDEGRSENPQATYNYAQTLIQRGEPDDFVKARPLLEGLLHWYSAGNGYRRPEVLGQLSRIYVREGKYDIAKQYATQSLDSLSPEKRKQQEDEFIVLGLVALHENDAKGAEGHFRAALRARSWFPEAYYDLARAQSRDARTDEALDSMKTALDQGYLDTLPAKQLSDLRRDADLANLQASRAYQELLEEQEEKLWRRGDRME